MNNSLPSLENTPLSGLGVKAPSGSGFTKQYLISHTGSMHETLGGSWTFYMHSFIGFMT